MTHQPRPVEADALRAAEAARRLGIGTKELVRLIHERRIDFVMVSGIAHVPEAALQQYQASPRQS